MIHATGIERNEIMGDWYEELEMERLSDFEDAPTPPEWTDEELEDFYRRDTADSHPAGGTFDPDEE